MNVHIVNYDLKRPGQDYPGLISEIKKSFEWWHYLESCWLINTNETAAQIFSRLSVHLDQNDRLLIISVGSDYEGWLTDDAWKWIRERCKVKV